MWSSSQIDDIELITKILPEFDGLQLKITWYFEGELLDGSAISNNYLINYVKIIGKWHLVKGIYPLLMNISGGKRLHKDRLPLYITILMYICIYIYLCAMVIKKLSYRIIFLYK